MTSIDYSRRSEIQQMATRLMPDTEGDAINTAWIIFIAAEMLLEEISASCSNLPQAKA